MAAQVPDSSVWAKAAALVVNVTTSSTTHVRHNLTKDMIDLFGSTTCQTNLMLPRKHENLGGIRFVPECFRGGTLSERAQLPGRRAGSGIPAAGVGLFSEMRAHHETLGQVLRILDDGRHDEQLSAVALWSDIEVLGHDRALAVGDTVLPQVSRSHVLRHDLEGSTRWRRRISRASTSRTAATARPLPLRHRITLPRRRPGRRRL